MRADGERDRRLLYRIRSFPSLVASSFLSICITKSGLTSRERDREREIERRREREKKATTEQLDPPLADIYTTFVPFFPPLVHLFFPPSLALIWGSVYCVIHSQSPEFHLVSSSVFLDLFHCPAFHLPPPHWILFHSSFCLFSFINLSYFISFSPLLAWFFPTLPDSDVFSLTPTPFFNWPPSHQSPCIFLSSAFLPHSSFFYLFLWRNETTFPLYIPLLTSLFAL